MLTAFFQNRFDAVFFPEALPAAYELNPDPFSAAIRSVFARRESRKGSAHFG
jgi:hypothetical protein